MSTTEAKRVASLLENLTEDPLTRRMAPGVWEVKLDQEWYPIEQIRELVSADRGLAEKFSTRS